MIIAIDGPAAAGKGTLARRLAAELGYDYLDTGLIYRAVGMNLVRADTDPADVAKAEAAAKALKPADLAAADLRNDEAAQAASKVAAIPGVRAALLDFQRLFAAQPPGGRGAVLDGRDIGTVVCPQAPIKLFVTASLEKRADRRLKELLDRGLEAIPSTVLADMRERDERDSKRAVAPLVPADDAFVLDTSDLDADQAFTAAVAFIRSRT
jgi:CMP/dCMP kinase